MKDKVKTKPLIDELVELRQRVSKMEKLETQLRQTEEKLRRREEALSRSGKLFRMFRECNQALVRATQEFLLLHDVCRIIVEVGGYRRVWIGYAKQDKEKTIQPVAWAGYEEGFQGATNITWADIEQGQNPAGIAIRSGVPSIARHTGASEIALPLISWQILGVLNIYGLKADDFEAEEVQVLAELADNLAYAIAALRTRTEHKEP